MRFNTVMNLLSESNLFNKDYIESLREDAKFKATLSTTVKNATGSRRDVLNLAGKVVVEYAADQHISSTGEPRAKTVLAPKVEVPVPVGG